MELEMFADGYIILIGSKLNLFLKNEEKLHGIVCLVRFIYDALPLFKSISTLSMYVLSLIYKTAYSNEFSLNVFFDYICIQKCLKVLLFCWSPDSHL